MLAITPRGYTGHEHVDAMGIIHMNGRIYDPKLGRFLQADPFIEDASTLNRYTYVHNNPLAYTDPSGYFSLRTFLRTVVAIAITVYSGFTVAALLKEGLAAKAFLTAVAGGAAAGAIQSGTIEGAAWGAFSAAVFFGIGQAIGGASSLWETVDNVKQLTSTGLAVKTISHGLAGGTLSKLQGGKFGHGFLSAAGSAATAPFADMSSAEGVWKGAAVSSVVGGTLSKLSGGKFANGAVTAVMQWAFNECSSGGCWATDEERKLANRGDYSGYYKKAGETDPYARRAGEVANKVGFLSELTTSRLGLSIFGNTENIPLIYRAWIFEDALNNIRIDLAQAHYKLLDQKGASPSNPVTLTRQEIADFHREVFTANGAGDVFGGTTWDRMRLVLESSTLIGKPLTRKLYDWCPPPSCKK